MSSIYFLLRIPFVQVSLCSGWYTEISIFTKAEESDYYSLSNVDVNASQRISIKVVIISESKTLRWKWNRFYLGPVANVH